MKQLSVTLHLFILSFLCSLCVAQTTTMQISFNFTKDDFEFTQLSNGCLYINALKDGCTYASDTLLPAMPFIDKNVYIGTDKQFTSFTVDKKRELIERNVMIAPNPFPLPTSIEPIEVVEASLPSYENRVYPEKVCNYVCTSQLRTGSILRMSVCPFEYDASTGNLYLIKEMTLAIILTDNLEGALGNNRTLSAADFDMLTSIVVNPPDSSAVVENSITHKSGFEDLDYLIITDQNLAQAFDDLAKWKTNKGVRTEIITTQQIYGKYPGDSASAIKKCLYDCYVSRNLKYALFGGDNKIVPVKAVKGYDFYHKYNDETYHIFVDLTTDSYFACFDGDFEWDANGNGICGEPGSYSNQIDGVNFTPSIYLTRLPVRTFADATNVVKKILKYESDPLSAEWNDQMLIAGSKLSEYFDSRSDAEIKGFKFYEEAIKPNWDGKCLKFFDTYKDLEVSDIPYFGTGIHKLLSEGFTFVSMMTHGNPHLWSYYNLDKSEFYYTIPTALQLKSNGFTILTTMSCDANAFDDETHEPCLSEALIRNPDNGIVVYFGSSRQGWYRNGTDGSKFGASLDIESEFYKELFSSKNKNYGEIAAKAKMKYINSIYDNSSYWRLQMALNPIGDPEMPIDIYKPKEIGRINLYIGNDSILISPELNGCNVCVSNKSCSNGDFFEYWEDVNDVGVADAPERFTVCVTKQGYVPKLFTVQIIQGSTLNTSPTQAADVFIIGNKISCALPSGDVIIYGENIKINAREVILTPGIGINCETDLEIINM